MTEKPMAQKHIYPGINCFKLLAALFVIMIHTSPLTSVSPEADFVLTRIIARTAVPFFFMVTGFFVLPKALGDTRRGLRYLRRIGLIYLASMLLYLPVNLYAGHFNGAGLGGLLKMILTDGTFYHLWYLPALLLGFALVWAGLAYLPAKAVFLISVFLYLTGLPGDSYYGFLKEGSVIYTVYEGIFHVSSYTRNGLFYAPVFLMLGYMISLQYRQGTAEKKPGKAAGKSFRSPRGKSAREALRCPPSFSLALAGFGVCSALFLAEGITLKILDVQRHDSMYLALVPLMYFLFCILLDVKGPDPMKRLPGDLPLLVYLLHPLFLILVRGFAGVTGLTVFTENSVVHFLAVAAASFAGSWILAILWALAKARILPGLSGRFPGRFRGSRIPRSKLAGHKNYQEEGIK